LLLRLQLAEVAIDWNKPSLKALNLSAVLGLTAGASLVDLLSYGGQALVEGLLVLPGAG